MRIRNTIPVVVCVLLLAAAVPATAVVRNYRATFDVSFQDLEGALYVAAQPSVEIQNPPSNNSAMVVMSVNVSWNPRVSSVNPIDGIIKHVNSQDCPVISLLNPQVLVPGEGLTINGMDVIESNNCRLVSACSGMRCSRWNPCPDPCRCVFLWPLEDGFCIDLVTPSLSLPDRITFEIEVDDGNNPAPPSVRAIDFIIENPTDPDLMQLRGVKGAEIDEDSVQ